MSAEPVSPRRPERCSSVEASSEGGMPTCSSSQSSRPGSMEPERVAMTSPSSGVKPIVVSTEMPPATAASEAPAPRWHVTTRKLLDLAPGELGGAPGRVRVREAVEAEAAKIPALAPLGRQRIRRRRLGHAGVEGRVEARHGRHVRQQRGSRSRARATTSADAAAQGRRVHGGGGRPARRSAPARRTRVPPWTMRWPTASTLAGPLHRRLQLVRVHRASRRRQVLGEDQLVVLADDGELEAARAGIDDEYAHASS